MRGVKGHVAKKRLVLMLFNETQGLSAEKVRGVGTFVLCSQLIATPH